MEGSSNPSGGAEGTASSPPSPARPTNSPARPTSSPARPMTNAARMNLQAKEEFRERRKKHSRKMSNKLGKTFQELENSLPEQFIPKEKTKEAIMEQTRKYAALMETQLSSAPCTAICRTCKKPRIACGCNVPEYLRQPMKKLDRRMEEYLRGQMRKALGDCNLSSSSSDDDTDDDGNVGNVGSTNGGNDDDNAAVLSE